MYHIIFSLLLAAIFIVLLIALINFILSCDLNTEQFDAKLHNHTTSKKKPTKVAKPFVVQTDNSVILDPSQYTFTNNMFELDYQDVIEAFTHMSKCKNVNTFDYVVSDVDNELALQLADNFVTLLNQQLSIKKGMHYAVTSDRDPWTRFMKSVGLVPKIHTDPAKNSMVKIIDISKESQLTKGASYVISFELTLQKLSSNHIMCVEVIYARNSKKTYIAGIYVTGYLIKKHASNLKLAEKMDTGNIIENTNDLNNKNEKILDIWDKENKTAAHNLLSFNNIVDSSTKLTMY